MSINVVVKQKLFGSKTMPLEVILGEELTFGSYSNEGLEVKKITGSEIVVFDLKNMARGFTVIWNPKEKKQIALSLPLPSTKKEITDFCLAVRRIAEYWNGKIEVDGVKMSLEEFEKGLDFHLKSNEAYIKGFCEEIISGKNNNLSFPAIRFDLTAGLKEAKVFIEEPDKFAEWLHEKQNTVAASPDARFYEDEGEICAYYMVVSGIPAILPKEPKVPLGAQNPFTGKALECEHWSVVFGIGREPIGKLEFSDFMGRVPKEKIVEFDDDKIQILALTEEEIRKIAE